jgi:saposin
MKVLFILALVVLASAQQFCSPCEGVISMIESYITQNTTEAELLQALENLCNLIPGSFGQECIQAIAQDGPAIIQQLLNMENPTVVCTQLGLCTSKPKIPKPVQKKTLDNCDICQLVMQYVETWVASNQTEQYIENMITQYCPLLGLPVSECNVIAASVPTIIAQIENGATPQVICQTMGLCPTRKPVAIKVAQPKVQGGADCSICIFVVGQIEDYIASNATETEIMNALNQACALLGSFQAQCQAVVKNLPAYIAQLEKAEDPTTICTQVGICTSKPKSARLPVRRLH